MYVAKFVNTVVHLGKFGHYETKTAPDVPYKSVPCQRDSLFVTHKLTGYLMNSIAESQ